jgi:hypothetical protein
MHTEDIAVGKTVRDLTCLKLICFINFTDGTSVSIAWNGKSLNPMCVKDGVAIPLTLSE